jgi:O-antigen biosynthesis protein WbqP
MKRFIDITISLPALILFTPVIIPILLIVGIITGCLPVLLQQRKLALEKEEIKIFKIRTIKASRSFKEKERRSRDVFNKSDYEQYVPLFCRWLRKSGLDEILQLINVIKGEMSPVGPRPLTISDLELLKKNEPELYERRLNLDSKPGITGYWQVHGRREDGAFNLIENDEYYERNKSLIMDIKLILKSIVVLLTASHSDSILRTAQGKQQTCLPDLRSIEY